MSLSTTILLRHSDTLTEQLSVIHDRLMELVEVVDRMACAIYDEQDGMLKTFINSTRKGVALQAYEFKLADSRSLSEMARTRQARVLDDIPREVRSSAPHARWVEEQGYLSSFTVPLFHGESLLAFVFFDSTRPAAFTTEVQRNLVLYCNLVSMAIQNQISMVRTLVESVRIARDLTEVRDFETGTHLERMARYSRLIARGVAKKWGLSDEFVESVYLFAPLHDIGKIGIPDRILLKPGRLDETEREVMKGHVDMGMKIVERVIGQSDEGNLVNVSILRNIVGGHHEFLDGSGYPRGLRGDAIPIEARIVAVADVYDALTTSRPYKETWSQEKALGEIRRMQVAGKLDADCVDALFLNPQELLNIQNRHMDKILA